MGKLMSNLILKEMMMSKSEVKARWSDERRWTPMDRTTAASIIRGNQRAGAHVYRKQGETHIKNWGLHLIIAKANGSAQ